MKNIMRSLAFLAVALASFSVTLAESSSDLEKSFPVSSGGKLIVSVSGGDIKIRTWDKSEVQMTVRNIGDESDRVEASQNGNTVTVKYKVSGGWWSSDRDIRFEFYVPSQFGLDLTTAGGDIDLGGSITGNVELSTSGGDLKIDDVEGSLDGRTSGGDIVAHEVSQKCTLSTSGGDIQVDHAAADLEVNTSGGEITIGTVGKDLKAVTAGGNIDVDKVGGEVDASTASGDVSLGGAGGSVTVSTSGGDINVSSGTGRVEATTSGGDVTVSGITGSVEASSSGGTVKVAMTPKGGEESRIESSGGDVYLYLPSDAKVTVHIEVLGGDDDAISSDFPVTLLNKSGSWGNQRAEIQLNGGGQDIYLHTSSGSAYIQKLNSFSR